MLVQVKICVDDVKKVCKDVTDIRCREGETIECRDEIKEVNQSQRGERFLFNPTRSLGRIAPQSTGTPVGTRTKQSAPPSSSPIVSLRRSRRYTRTSNIFTSLIKIFSNDSFEIFPAAPLQEECLPAGPARIMRRGEGKNLQKSAGEDL